ncbi:MAG: hypothetical protein JO181_01005 [Solirubrobacterales bacterium]|nr:hypothetical protein [Solirubrobacterales bacterium]
MAVHVAARVGAIAQPDEVLVSGTVRDLVMGSGIEFADRGARELKGVPGEWRLFAVEAAADRGPDGAQLAPVRPRISDRVARLFVRRAPALARASTEAVRRRSAS